MINLPVAMSAHLAGSSTSIAFGLKVTRRDAQVFAFCSCDTDITIDSVLYTASNGISVSSLVSSAGFAVGNMEITTLNDGSVYHETEVLNGLWNGAEYEICVFDFTNPDATKTVLSAGHYGEAKINDGYVVIELRDLRQLLQQPLGEQSSQTCRAEFGSTSRPAGLCRKDLTGLQVSGSITNVTSNQVFRDAARIEVTDYFGNGWLEFTTGNNAGVRITVTDYDADGTFHIPLVIFGEVQVGDEYIAMPGCRKTPDACKTWGNYLNYQGEPNRPNRDTIITIREAAG